MDRLLLTPADVVVVVVVKAKSAWTAASLSSDLDQRLVYRESLYGNVVVVAAQLIGPLGTRTTGLMFPSWIWRSAD